MIWPKTCTYKSPKTGSNLFYISILYNYILLNFREDYKLIIEIQYFHSLRTSLEQRVRLD